MLFVVTYLSYKYENYRRPNLLASIDHITTLSSTKQTQELEPYIVLHFYSSGSERVKLVRIKRNSYYEFHTLHQYV